MNWLLHGLLWEATSFLHWKRSISKGTHFHVQEHCFPLEALVLGDIHHHKSRVQDSGWANLESTQKQHLRLLWLVTRKHSRSNVIAPFFIPLIVSRCYSENPAVWLVAGAGRIFQFLNHSHGNHLQHLEHQYCWTFCPKKMGNEKSYRSKSEFWYPNEEGKAKKNWLSWFASVGIFSQP